MVKLLARNELDPQIRLPEREDHGMPAIKRLAHSLHSAVFLVILHVSEKILLGVAKVISDCVAVLARTEDGARRAKVLIWTSVSGCFEEAKLG